LTKKYVMSETPKQRKNVVIARAGLVLGFFVFFLTAGAAHSSGAAVLVTMAIGSIAGLCLWAAIFASEKVALFLGRWLP
jgi:hypothetical protein